MSIVTPKLKSTIVRAGAGAGKTTELTTRVILYAKKFHGENGHWPRLVVSTFTRKATQELRERLIRKACDEKDWELLQYVSSASQLHISTIHGVLSLFLKRYGRLAGLDPNFSIISDAQAKVFLRRLLRQVIFDKLEYSALLEEYRVSEILQILTRHYPLWILSSRSIKALSKEESETQMTAELERIADNLKSICSFLERQDLSASEDYQKFLAQLKSIENSLRTKGFTELDALMGEWPKRPNAVKKANKIFEAEQNKQLDDELKEGFKLLTSCVSEMLSWDKLSDLHSAYSALAEDIFVKWRNDKATRGQLQMEDLELLAYEVIHQRPDLAALFALDWDYWLVDEYQDTSPLQDFLIERLKGNAPAFFVGDPQQSIYLFRGARFENFEEKMKLFEAQNEEVEFKIKHYRSRGELLEFFNDFFTGTDSRFLKMTPHREVVDPNATVTYFYAFEKPMSKEEPHPELLKLAHKIKQLLEGGSGPKDIAILARKSNDLKLIFDFLKARAFPVQLQSSGDFQERREILDLICFLRFLINPHDNSNLVGLLRTPWSRINDSHIIEAASQKASSLWIGLSSLESLKDNETLNDLKTMRELGAEFAATDVLENWMLKSGLVDWSRKIDPSGRREANIWKWFHSLRVAEKQPGFNFLSWLKEFQSSPDLEKDNQEGDALSSLEPDRIQLMTIHAAKGLEFSHVLIPFCAGSRTPNDNALWYGDLAQNRYSLNIKNEMEQKRIKTCWIQSLCARKEEKEQEESLRVLYVGMTRAKESLSLLWTKPASLTGWSHLFESWLTKYQMLGAGGSEARPYKVHFDSEVPEEVVYTPKEKIWDTPRALFQAASLPESTPKKISVSQVLEVYEKKNHPQSSLTSPVDSTPVAPSLQKWGKAAEGVLIHRIFETLKYRDKWDIKELVSKHFPERTEEVSTGLTWALSLDAPPMERLIREGEVEWGYQFKAPFGLIEGQIDLWGEIPEEKLIWIVDYKTGKPEYEEKAFRQLWLYSLALQKLKPGRRVKMAVVYPLAKKLSVVEAPTDPVVWSPQGGVHSWPELKIL